MGLTSNPLAVVFIGRGTELMSDEPTESIIMSQHSSLRGVTKIRTKRNVLKRFERIDLLRSRGLWKEGDRGQGLPKTKPTP